MQQAKGSGKKDLVMFIHVANDISGRAYAFILPADEEEAETLSLLLPLFISLVLSTPPLVVLLLLPDDCLEIESNK